VGFYTMGVSKLLFLLVLAGVTGALIVGGALEVKFHPEALGDVPGRVLAFTTEQGVLERGRVLLTRAKRIGEQALLRDASRKTEVSLLYIQNDADRLKELMNSGKKEVGDLQPQAELLTDSVQGLNKLSFDDIARHKDKAQESIATAVEALSQLKAIQQAQQAAQEQLARVTASLEEQLDPFTSGIVAGTKNNPTTSPTPTLEPTPTPTIPLQF
jgi:hypothetical protein